MNILFLSHRLPYAPNRGDRVRAYHLLREMRRWAEVHLISLAHDPEEESHAGDLENLVSSVTTVRVPRLTNATRAAFALASGEPLTHLLLRSPEMLRAVTRAISTSRPDLVFSYCTGVAPYALVPALRHVPLVLDMVDVDSAKWQALSASSAPPLSWIYRREARLLRAFETDVTARARLTLVVNEKERSTLAQFAKSGNILAIGNGVDVEYLRRPAERESSQAVTVVFCGVMNYAPNVDGAIWLAREVWPRVKRLRPEATLQIVGSRPSRVVRRLADERAGVEVTGEVADVRPYLWDATVAVAPLRTARGIQNKVLEALAAGAPVVTTSEVAAGLPADLRLACTVADGADVFASAIASLVENRTSRPARKDLTGISWARQLAGLEAALQTAGRRLE